MGSVRDIGQRNAPTLESVAAQAGVSRATASRVLTGSPNVSPASREAVLAASQELGYQPNRAARSLVTRRSGCIAVVISETEDLIFSDPFFLPLVRGVHSHLTSRDLQLLFSIAGTEPERQQLIGYAAGGHLDGVVLVSLHGDDPLPQQLEAAGVPVVVMGRSVDAGAPGIHYVDTDNRAGARSATELLLQRGCTSVVHIAGPDDMAAGQDRRAGFQDSLAAARVDDIPSRVATGDFTSASGYTAMRTLLEAHPELDGVFAASDLMAIGAMEALREDGRGVPDDVAVVGFDDGPTARSTRPTLTTVRQPVELMGRQLARTLIDRLDGIPVPPGIVLPTEIVRRESA